MMLQIDTRCARGVCALRALVYTMTIDTSIATSEALWHVVQAVVDKISVKQLSYNV